MVTGLHERYMRHALTLALRAKGLTSPNPLVGACVVKNRKIIGEGFHKMAGLPHAEADALNAAGAKTRGAALYVTLEPCDHFGRTPPCTDAIIKSGIKEVIIAMRDPNPINNGRGIRRLKNHGIKTLEGISEDEAKAINRPYVKFITRKIPYVTLKLAESLDGKIATRLGDSKWITGDASRQYVHKLRGEVDAIMVGVNTLLRDDPMLTIRPAKRGAALHRMKRPVRIIVDSGLRTPRNANIFSAPGKYPVIIATTKDAGMKKVRSLERLGADVIITGSLAGKVGLKGLFRKLAKMGIMHILVEGGGELAANLIENKLVDHVLFFVAPKIIGGKTAVTSIAGKGVGIVSKALHVKNMRSRRFGEDILIEGDIR